MLEWQTLGLHWMRRACGLAWQAKTQKLSDFDFLSREKRGFYRFSFIIHGWNAVFSVFRSSSVDETQKLLFSARHPWMKPRNCCFSLVIRGWNPEIAVFCSSSVDETRFLPFFYENRGRFWLPTIPKGHDMKLPTIEYCKVGKTIISLQWEILMNEEMKNK